MSFQPHPSYDHPKAYRMPDQALGARGLRPQRQLHAARSGEKLRGHFIPSGDTLSVRTWGKMAIGVRRRNRAKTYGKARHSKARAMGRCGPGAAVGMAQEAALRGKQAATSHNAGYQACGPVGTAADV